MSKDPNYIIEIRNMPLAYGDLRFIIPIEMDSDDPPYWTYKDFNQYAKQEEGRLGAVALLRKAADGKHIKSRDGNRVVGYICLRFMEEFLRFKGKMILIEKLVIDREFRRKRIGMTFLGWVASLLTEKMPLMVFPIRIDNIDAQKFLGNGDYGSQSFDRLKIDLYRFHNCGFVEKYYPNGETAAIYRYRRSPFLMLTYEKKSTDICDADVDTSWPTGQ